MTGTASGHDTATSGAPPSAVRRLPSGRCLRPEGKRTILGVTTGAAAPWARAARWRPTERDRFDPVSERGRCAASLPPPCCCRRDLLRRWRLRRPRRRLPGLACRRRRNSPAFRLRAATWRRAMPRRAVTQRRPSAYYRNALKVEPRNPELLRRTFLAVLFDGDIEEATRLADRVLQVDRNDRTARLVLGVRAIKQKQYALARQHIAHVGRRSDHRSCRRAARGLDLHEPGRDRDGGRDHRQAHGRRLVRHFQGPACGHDPRPRRQQERGRQATGEGLQGRFLGTARGRSLWPLGVAQCAEGRSGEDFRDLRQGARAPSADRERDGSAQDRPRPAPAAGAGR